MSGNPKSNYEKMKDSMADVFLQYDQDKIIDKFSLEHDSAYIYICFFGLTYGIDRHTGKVLRFTHSNSQDNADYNEAMTIYDVLCYSKDRRLPSHEWVNISSLSAVKSGFLTKSGDFFAGSGEYFSGKTELLKIACESLGGRQADGGDIAYEMDMFPFLQVLLRFWDADDEFPPSLQILVDKTILYYMHYETLMFAMTHMLNRLRDEMNMIKK